MLSVKIIDRHGFERVKECDETHYCPELKGHTPEDHVLESLDLLYDGHVEKNEKIQFAAVFIMNSNGKTIAHYFLNDGDALPEKHD